ILNAASPPPTPRATVSCRGTVPWEPLRTPPRRSMPCAARAGRGPLPGCCETARPGRPVPGRGCVQRSSGRGPRSFRRRSRASSRPAARWRRLPRLPRWLQHR
ncbi:unnamed protein product, partial [Effrenium voratum]